MLQTIKDKILIRSICLFEIVHSIYYKYLNSFPSSSVQQIDLPQGSSYLGLLNSEPREEYHINHNSAKVIEAVQTKHKTLI